MIYKKKAAIQITAVLLVSSTLTAGGVAPSFEAVDSIALKESEVKTQELNRTWNSLRGFNSVAKISNNTSVAGKTNDGTEKPPNPGDGSDKHTMTVA